MLRPLFMLHKNRRCDIMISTIIQNAIREYGDEKEDLQALNTVSLNLSSKITVG